MAAPADKVHGHIIPFLNGYNVNVIHEPHGVTGHIPALELSGADVREVADGGAGHGAMPSC